MSVRNKPFKITSFGVTDIGLVRQNNEDTLLELPKYNFFAVADGMGGHQGGEVASHETISFLTKEIATFFQELDEELTLDETRHAIIDIIEDANKHVYKMGRDDYDLRGMGTTLCSLLFHPKGVVYAHVGDSRIYRVRNGRISQMTKDHSLVRELVDIGQIREQQVGEYLYRNIITKALGTEAVLEPSARVSEVRTGDLYLLCTDGLTDPVKREELEALLLVEQPLEEKAQALIDAAKAKGGYDNITLILVRVDDHGKKIKSLSR